MPKSIKTRFAMSNILYGCTITECNYEKLVQIAAYHGICMSGDSQLKANSQVFSIYLLVKFLHQFSDADNY
jgi:hypothetical protein